MRESTLLSIGVVVVLTFSAMPAISSDVAAGATVFKKCKACHSILPEKKRVGPSLYGVVGRKPASAAGYKYSAAMQKFAQDNAVWDAQTLDKYLESPRTIVPKSRMVFVGLKKPSDRQAVIAYLDSLDDTAADTP